MQSYVSRSGKKSGIIGYEVGIDHIIVQFRTGLIYKYSNAITGKNHVDIMTAKALAQIGLSTYIANNKTMEFEWKR